MTEFEAQRILISEVNKDFESHLRTMTLATKRINAFVLETRKESIVIMPSLKE